MGDSYDVAAAVERGVTLLNSKMPDWYLKVDPDELGMHCATTCILGQLYGNYHEGLKVIGWQFDYLDEVWWQAIEHGFAILPSGESRHLRGEWARRIQQARGENNG